MGDPIYPYPPEYGIDCSVGIPAWWKSGKTPKYIYVCFYGIEKCMPEYADPPNGVRLTMVQHPDYPCLWEWGSPDSWYAQFWIDSSHSTLQLHCNAQLPSEYFYSQLDGLQCYGFENGYTCPFNAAEGGGAEIWWNDYEEASKLCFTYGLHPISDNLFDDGLCVDGKKWIKVAHTFDKTNILIKYDPDLLPP